MKRKYLTKRQRQRAFAIADNVDSVTANRFSSVARVLGAFLIAKEDEGLYSWELSDISNLLVERRDEIGFQLLAEYAKKPIPKAWYYK